MLAEDQNAFLRVVQERNPIMVITRDSDSAEVQPADLDTGPDKTLCLWNRRLLPHLKRKWIPDLGYDTIDGLRTPTLEFTPSFTATWEGKPGLGQGRLFGDFVHSPLIESESIASHPSLKAKGGAPISRSPLSVSQT